jgi:meiotically up-regulated gene 157 (Mug157) protein
MLLSSANPNFFFGSTASGIGSYHTPRGNIWPLALIIQAMTATTSSEKSAKLKELLASDPGDHYLHESFNASDAQNFTRLDFGWPNSLFVEFIMTAYDGVPPLPIPSR